MNDSPDILQGSAHQLSGPLEHGLRASRALRALMSAISHSSGGLENTADAAALLTTLRSATENLEGVIQRLADYVAELENPDEETRETLKRLDRAVITSHRLTSHLDVARDALSRHALAEE